jgi:hypothetical protein
MTVRRRSAERPLRHRIIAIAAAYVIALSGLIASFGAARAAAAAATAADPGSIICHTITPGEPSPAPATDETNNKLCAECCSIGCLMLMAAVPPPPATAVGVLQSPGQPLALPAIVVPGFGPQTKSHQSQAPPHGA